jgi:hypothetical protein
MAMEWTRCHTVDHTRMQGPQSLPAFKMCPLPIAPAGCLADAETRLMRERGGHQPQTTPDTSKEIYSAGQTITTLPATWQLCYLQQNHYGMHRRTPSAS